MPRLRLLVVVALLSIGASTVMHAQWLNYPTPGTPRTHDGKPNLTAPTPRVNGKPDLSGVWHVQPTPVVEWRRLLGDRLVDDALKLSVPGMEPETVSKYAANILFDFKPDEAPVRPEATRILRLRAGGNLTSSNCQPLGIPLNILLDGPDRVVQSSKIVVMLLEVDGTQRQIYTDGRELPKEVAQPSWLGYSVGKWVHDTLVVETAGFNDKTWLDGIGHPHSEGLRIVERYRRRDFGHMDVEMTFDAPTRTPRRLPSNLPKSFKPTPISSRTSAMKTKRTVPTSHRSRGYPS